MPPLLKRMARVAATGVLAVLLLVTTSPRSAYADQGGLIRDTEIEDTLRVYATPVWNAAGLTPSDIHLFIIEDSSINAFVSGGENLFVNTGTLLAARTPNEVIGVMAHETGHIAGGHLARGDEMMSTAMRPALISIGLGVLAIMAGAPDAGAALIAGAPAFAQGNLVRHTQVQESSADQAGMTFLDASHQSGRGLIDFFNHNLRQYEFQMRRAPPYLITHPFTSDRVEALRVRAEASAYYNATDTADNLTRFALMQAKLYGFLRTEGETLARYPLSDTSDPARYARAVAYYRASELDKARAELNTLIAANPNNPYYNELMGQALFENGLAAQSVPYHRRSTVLDPNQPLLMVNLARALVAANGRAGSDEAVGLLQNAIRIEPDNAFAWRELAEARELRGERGLAELASAEQNFAMGDYGTALNFAERARRTLDHGTPSFVRANDIATFAGEQVREHQRHNGQGGQGLTISAGGGPGG